jgi:hypothetical protein
MRFFAQDLTASRESIRARRLGQPKCDAQSKGCRRKNTHAWGGGGYRQNHSTCLVGHHAPAAAAPVESRAVALHHDPDKVAGETFSQVQEWLGPSGCCTRSGCAGVSGARE